MSETSCGAGPSIPTELPIDPDDGLPQLCAASFDGLQPHQVRKKEALAARYQGLADAGVAPIETRGLRIPELGRRIDAERFAHERSGARRRIQATR